MRVVNIGSLNIDDVYKVAHIVRPGEAVTSQGYTPFCGGKGLNQSIALANAGAQVYHAGKIGADGELLRERLAEAGVDTHLIDVADTPTGRAFIQVASEGENAILLYSGANRAITPDDVDRYLEQFSTGDLLLLQNEVSCIAEAVEAAEARGLKIVLNPSPLDDRVLQLPLEKIDMFIVNEIEGRELSGREGAREVLSTLSEKYPKAEIVLTLGARGVYYRCGGQTIYKEACKVTPINTTGAGDTFTGFFIATLIAGSSVEDALSVAVRAAAISTTRPGVSDSIPKLADLR